MRAKNLDPAVGAVLDKQPTELKAQLLELRTLIINTAAATEGVGTLTETLKWGEPAYLPEKPKVGTTIRINASKIVGGGTAMFFNCNTTLVETFREHYPDTFVFERNRALHFKPDKPLPAAELRHCIALALTYHLARR